MEIEHKAKPIKDNLLNNCVARTSPLGPTNGSSAVASLNSGTSRSVLCPVRGFYDTFATKSVIGFVSLEKKELLCGQSSIDCFPACRRTGWTEHYPAGSQCE